MKEICGHPYQISREGLRADTPEELVEKIYWLEETKQIRLKAMVKIHPKTAKLLNKKRENWFTQ